MIRSFAHQRAFSLIEVLVTILILSVGLLGIAGLQARLQMSEVEAYQRSQALILLNDMANRLAGNRNAAASYATGSTSPVGYGTTCSTSTATRKDVDLGEWCTALQGGAESDGENRVGAMTGGRGCIESLGGGEYLITVAWQGMTPIAAPPAGLACGTGLYNGDAGSSCSSDRCRRVVSTVVRIPNL
ncbi:type IV pilus modification protein PilV [Pseudomonas sp. AN-1]|uniref:type IV pilus modification protein PilV n=1 Tax=Pseudomonas sp. AN-1 TaxID=3096605 RepID=UPI002A6B5125|nr:type IV pilus modification protein PilV [Pseudomonas sp. AN-1]WPP45950.1 type IV pilus modification protein PilV [Pseudomonas sp. AN-1]